MVVKFYGVENGIDRCGDGGHDENCLGSDRRERIAQHIPEMNEEPRTKGTDNKSDKAGEPGIRGAE